MYEKVGTEGWELTSRVLIMDDVAALTVHARVSYRSVPNGDCSGIVTFTKRFRYLGSIVDGSLSGQPEVVHRVQAATAFFARLKQPVIDTDLGNSPLPACTRAKIYTSLVLGILLYGCESWVLTEVLRTRLEPFHNRCVRAMRGLTHAYIRTLCGGHDTLNQRHGIPSMQHAAAARLYQQATLGRLRGEDRCGEAAPQVLLIVDQRREQASRSLHDIRA